MCNYAENVFYKYDLWVHAAALLLGFMAFAPLCVMEIQKMFAALQSRSLSY
jgi:hypothetical protein